jgi:pimeloyl-ACP methyl ester carboxylesterase
MPFLTVNQAKLHYRETGRGPDTIVFSHGLLMNGDMFRDQAEYFADRYRCIRYDHRGQGGSEVTRNGYDMDSLTDDAAALIRALDCAPCHFVGLSMGGFVGMRLAVRHPELVRSLTLMETSADPEPVENKGPYRRLAFVGRWFGYRFVVNPVMKIMFGRTFLGDPSRAGLREEWRQKLMALDRRGINQAAHGVIDRDGFYGHLGGITAPTLILVGDEDVATPAAKSRRMHQAIASSKLVVIQRAGHSSSIEEPEAVNRALDEFFRAQAAGQ